MQHIGRILVGRKTQMIHFAGSPGVFERAVQLLVGDDGNVVGRHVVVRVDVVDAHFGETFVEGVGPAFGCFFGLLQGDFFIPIDVDGNIGFRDQEDVVAPLLEKRCEIFFRVVIVVLEANIEGVDAGVERGVEQVVVWFPGQRRPAPEAQDDGARRAADVGSRREVVPTTWSGS